MAGKKTPEEVQKLIQVYSDAKIKILQTLQEKEAKGNSTAYQKSLLQQIDVILEGLNKEVVSWSDKNVLKYYKEKLAGIAEELQREITASSFSKIHRPAIELLTENLIDNLTEANNFVGRKMRDTFRKVSLEVTAEKFAVGLTVKETKKRLIEEFLKNGITGFRDKAGRQWQLDTYAAMVANTTYGEVANWAVLNQAEAWDYDLVKILENNSSCPICAPLEGRVYSRTGKDKRFPLLDIAYSGDNLLIHPNCLHTLAIYVPELSDTLGKDIKFSNRPFEIDPRTQKKVDLYNKIQAGKREIRQDRKQFEKFKLALGKKAPKTFSAFRNIKKNYPHKFDEYLEDYKLSGYKPARKEIEVKKELSSEKWKTMSDKEKKIWREVISEIKRPGEFTEEEIKKKYGSEEFIASGNSIETTSGRTFQRWERVKSVFFHKDKTSQYIPQPLQLYKLEEEGKF